ncbi:MAG TPA: asparagine synthase (glutamine-hydrolyzing) [Candidatus Andersenbacteria bacterium]|nr:asparagine synthase (glutamine-hydrolyzing) [Candidatus Andersenbacteria bacterium]
MCGITGVWNFGSTSLSKQAFDRFTDSLAHRGPDGRGVYYSDVDHLHLGHRRLAILDLSPAGRQPMSYRDGRYQITFNGEIYNYLEIREQLRTKGYSFTTNSDTEVIIAAYDYWQEDCQLQFNGMWAFAIWDIEKKELFLSRDRFGVKPLHYIANNEFFAFASEMKAFKHLEGWKPTIDESIIAENLIQINGLEGSEHSILKEVRKLQGGHCMRVHKSGAISKTRWWQTSSHIHSEGNFKDLFTAACDIRLRSDVPVATSLSGGLDSSSIAATIAQIRRRHNISVPQNVFIAHFPNTNQDELSYALDVAQYAGILPVIDRMDTSVAPEDVDAMLWSYEDIYWAPLFGPRAIYASMRKRGFLVTLDGHGADELLGGYHFQVLYALYRSLVPIPNIARYYELQHVLVGLQGGSVTNIPQTFIRTLVQGFHQSFAAEHLRNIGHSIHPAQFLRQRISEPKLLYDHNAPSCPLSTPLHQYMYSKMHNTILPTILRNFDRASMAHGVEIRMPFLDWRLVTYALSLPDSQLIGNGYTKRVLRDAMKDILPEHVRLRTNKMGFTSPTDLLLRGSLKNWMMNSITSKEFVQSPIWDSNRITAFVRESLQDRRAGSLEAIWPYLNAHSIIRQWRAI